MSEGGTSRPEDDRPMDERGPEPHPSVHLVLASVLFVIVVGGMVDLILDAPPTLLSGHVLFELFMIAVSLSAATYLGGRWFRASRSVVALERAVERHQAEHDVWRERAARVLKGLGEEIAHQFEAWGLTPAERETAMGLLKGYSHKRIARDTDRSERTVRQHAVAVYRKSGVAGRAELAAFFLGDVSLPPEPAE